ncbi:MAG: hypothetical protein U9O94_06975, partial [Nanoarchaeota archaeon]|nr:hypothetical protein [Nanoarchaeota archaeon]
TMTDIINPHSTVTLSALTQQYQSIKKTSSDATSELAFKATFNGNDHYELISSINTALLLGYQLLPQDYWPSIASDTKAYYSYIQVIGKSAPNQELELT